MQNLMASIQQGPNGPVLVLKESALQQKGKDAQQNNIAAAKLVDRPDKGGPYAEKYSGGDRCIARVQSRHQSCGRYGR